MLGIGWIEMMIIAAVALIVIGPRDLPVMLRNLGKAMGTVQRMGREFQKELNKMAAADEIREIKKSISSPLRETGNELRGIQKSISAPLKQTTDDISREFNKTAADGSTKPTGAIAPKDPKAESVAEEIREKAGMAPAPKRLATVATTAPAKRGPAKKTDAAPSSTAGKAKANAPAEASAKTSSPAKSSSAKSGASRKTAAKPASKPASKSLAKAGSAEAEGVPKKAARRKPAAKAKQPEAEAPPPEAPAEPRARRRRKPAETTPAETDAS